jgi:chromatin structure-remodeling complex subunit RSC1/2
MAPRTAMNGTPGHPTSLQPQLSRPSPSLAQNQYGHQSISPAPQYNRTNSYNQPANYRANIQPSTTAQQKQQAYSNHQQMNPQGNTAPASNYALNAISQSTTGYQPRNLPQPQQSQPTAPQTQQLYANYAQSLANANTLAQAHPPPTQQQTSAEVFVLSDAANASIPSELREIFPKDDQGRVLFFTKAPVVHGWTVRGSNGEVLKHSERYLEANKEKEKLKGERKRAREEEAAAARKKEKLRITS